MATKKSTVVKRIKANPKTSALGTLGAVAASATPFVPPQYQWIPALVATVAPSVAALFAADAKE